MLIKATFEMSLFIRDDCQHITLSHLTDFVHVHFLMYCFQSMLKILARFLASFKCGKIFD